MTSPVSGGALFGGERLVSMLIPGAGTAALGAPGLSCTLRRVH